MPSAILHITKKNRNAKLYRSSLIDKLEDDERKQIIEYIREAKRQKAGSRIKYLKSRDVLEKALEDETLKKKVIKIALEDRMDFQEVELNYFLCDGKYKQIKKLILGGENFLFDFFIDSPKLKRKLFINTIDKVLEKQNFNICNYGEIVTDEKVRECIVKKCRKDTKFKERMLRETWFWQQNVDLLEEMISDGILIMDKMPDNLQMIISPVKIE